MSRYLSHRAIQLDQIHRIDRSPDRNHASCCSLYSSPDRNTAPGISSGSRTLLLLKDCCSAHRCRRVHLDPISIPWCPLSLLSIVACSDDPDECRKPPLLRHSSL